MTPEQEPEPANIPPEQPPPASTSNPRGRRSGRGHRGRGRRRSHAPQQQPPPATEVAPEPAQLPLEPAQTLTQAAPVERQTTSSPPFGQQPASPTAVQAAIEEVTQIIETLRATLDDM